MHQEGRRETARNESLLRIYTDKSLYILPQLLLIPPPEGRRGYSYPFYKRGSDREDAWLPTVFRLGSVLNSKPVCLTPKHSFNSSQEHLGEAPVTAAHPRNTLLLGNPAGNMPRFEPQNPTVPGPDHPRGSQYWSQTFSFPMKRF